MKSRLLFTLISCCMVVPVWAVDNPQPQKAGANDSIQDCAVCPEMLGIPAGTFQMGSNEGENDEKPVHAVSVEKFYMSTYEATFDEYDAFVAETGREKPDDKGWGRGKRPVMNVSWHDAVAYAAWLSKKTGKNYRLPTEAEWEYAARAGTTTTYWWGNEVGRNHANCNGCGGEWNSKKITTVGSFLPNPFGLYDTSGNLWEWTCSEYAPYSEDKHLKCAQAMQGNPVVRGGSWYYKASQIRSAYRSYILSDFGNVLVGFRLVLKPH